MKLLKSTMWRRSEWYQYICTHLTKKDRLTVSFDSKAEEQFIDEFLKYHCPTPIRPDDAPYKYCRTCFYCTWHPYRECRIYTMMRDGRIYGDGNDDPCGGRKCGGECEIGGCKHG